MLGAIADACVRTWEQGLLFAGFIAPATSINDWYMLRNQMIGVLFYLSNFFFF